MTTWSPPTYTVQDAYVTRYLRDGGGGMVDPPRYRPMLDIARRAIAQDWHVSLSLCTAEMLETGAAGGVIIWNDSYRDRLSRVEVDPPVPAGAMFATLGDDDSDPLIVVRAALDCLRFVTAQEIATPGDPALIRRISLTSFALGR